MKLPVTHPSVRDLFQTLGRHEAFQQGVEPVFIVFGHKRVTSDQ